MNGKRKQHAISHFFKLSLVKKNQASNEKNDVSVSKIQNFSYTNDNLSSKSNENNDKDPAKIPNSLLKPSPKPSPTSTKRKSLTPIAQKRPKIVNTKLTPLENQILELKQENQDKLLVIQVGYKYKLFGEDAKIASKILNIMYIVGSKDDLRQEQFAYCSFPDFKLHINLKRLLNHGYKIGVVKQMESAIVKEIEKQSKTSDLMKRELTAVYTKGTYMGDEFEDKNGVPDSENQASYIIAINEISSNEFALVAVQPLTGEILFDTFEDGLNRNEMETRVLYLNPSEVIILNSNESPSWETRKLIKSINPDVAIFYKLPCSNILDKLTGYFATIDPNDEEKYVHLIEYYSINFSTSIQQCIIELIVYLTEFKLSNVFTIVENIAPFTNNSTYMVLPANTLQTLEIFVNATDPSQTRGTLVWLLDHTRTRFGRRLLRKWISRPLIDVSKIEERQQAIADLSSEFNYVIDSLKNFLQKVNLDLEELIIKVHYTATYKTSRIHRKEVFLMLECFNELLTIIQKFEKSILELSFKSPLLINTLQDLLKVSKTPLISDLLQCINPSFLLVDHKDTSEQAIQFFNLGYREWPAIIQQKNEIENIESSLEQELAKVSSILGRPKLKYVTCNREPYLIEVKNGSEVDKLPDFFQRVSGTKAVSRFRTIEINRLYKLLQYHQELLIKSCDEAFHSFLQEIESNYFTFAEIVKHLSTIDCVLSLTAASHLSSNYSRPKLVSNQIIQIEKGRNPIIESLQNVHHYVPNDTHISYDKNRVMIITGPNMGGKSSYVKQVALLVIMTQIGCYIPCESATIGIFDSIFIRMGASDNILKGHSTFMTEMLECSQIIKKMSNKSLIILDEIGRGTGTSDGIAIAHSILNYLAETKLKPLVLFITHYPSLHILEDAHKGLVTNYHMGFQQIQKEGQEFPEVIFLYSLVNGVINNLYGLNVAKLAGIPSDIISRAFNVSEELKNKIEVENIESLCKKVKSLLKQEQFGNMDQIIDLFNCI